MGRPDLIGDERCHGREYNTPECGFDGGDCMQFNEDYPDCPVDCPECIGNGFCSNEHNTPECRFDGGDCDWFNDLYPDCRVDSPTAIGNGRCHGGAYNTPECGFDGGDCMQFNGDYPDCDVEYPWTIGNGDCTGGAYNTPECGIDGGDCFIDSSPPDWWNIPDSSSIRAFNNSPCFFYLNLLCFICSFFSQILSLF